MTDLEITKLCAQAMGWKHLGAVGVQLSEDERHSPSEVDKKFPGQLWCLSGGNDWWTDPDGHNVCAHCSGIPEPLHDDAQAMALVKKFDKRMTIQGQSEIKPPYQTRWAVWIESTSSQIGAHEFNSSLNRAICECVANMQISAK